MTHRRSNSTKILNDPNKLFIKKINPEIENHFKTRTVKSSYRQRPTQTKWYSRNPSPIKNLKNIDLIVGRCDSELKKIRKISEKIKNSRKKIVRNKEIISDFIQAPLYSIKFLKKVKPQYLNRYFKYQ